MFTCVLREKASPAPTEVKSALEAAVRRASALCGAVNRGELNDAKNGLGQFLWSAVALRTAVAMAIGLSAAQRTSEIEQLVTNDTDADG